MSWLELWRNAKHGARAPVHRRDEGDKPRVGRCKCSSGQTDRQIDRSIDNAPKLTIVQYANGNQWATMFGSRTVNIASDLPLWAAQWDGVDTLSSVHTFMGGWTKAFAKQYGQSSGKCAGPGAFDLNIFTE